MRGGLLSWELQLVQASAGLTPEAAAKALLSGGTPRILDIGCGGGEWCKAMKKLHPDWVIQGVDDVDRWSVSNSGLDYK